jgi:hypothetical protein
MNGRKRIGCGLLAGAVACLLAPSAASAMDCGLPGDPGTGMTEILDVQGDIAAAKTGGYLQIPFTVAPGQTGIQVRYSYDQQGDGTGPDPMGRCTGSGNTLDMGVYQPKADESTPIWEQTDRRGWSGSAVKNLAISENGFSDETTYNSNRKAFVNGRTTRAYEPGPIQPGEWAVELGIAYVAPDSATDTNGIHYHVQVLQSNDPTWSDDAYEPSGPPASSINSTPGWYTGDLHVHGEMEPGNATMSETFDAAFGAGGAGLDFITLVDHNNNIAHNDMETQAGDYPDNLVIPGTEVTTYQGHWNNQGSSNFADFRTGPVYGPNALSSPIPDSALVEKRGPVPPKTEFAHAQAGGGWAQINHPATFKNDPAGCRGCAWTYSDADTDFSKVDAIEVHNSFGPLSGSPFTLDAIAYYDHALDSGAHIAAVASSDAHKADQDPVSHVGEGVTVVGAEGLSKQAIIDAVKADHTYVKPFGPSGPDISLEGTDAEGDQAIIGDSLSGSDIELTATVSGIAATGRTGDWELELLQDGVPIDSTPITGDGIDRDYDVSESGRYSIEVTRTYGSDVYIEDYSSPIWVTAIPSNAITVGKAKLNKKKGTAKLQVKVPGPGSLKLTGKSLVKSKATATQASQVGLKVAPKGKLKKKLRKRGKLTVKPSITFTPDGGEAATVKAIVKLKYKRHSKHKHR